MEVPTDFPYSGEKWPRPERNKAAMITRLDTAVGQIMAKLKEYKLDEDTLILFTSDNGPHQEGGNNPAFSAVPAHSRESRAPVRGRFARSHDCPMDRQH